MKTNNIDFLFAVFPRDVGIPSPFQKKSFYRKEVTCKRDFHRYLSLMSGNNRGTYVSIYDDNDKITIDKFIFDLDSEDLNDALMDTDTLMDRLSKRNIPSMVVFSGKKGFHVYSLLKPIKLPQDIAGYYLSNLQRCLSKDLKTNDSHIVGDTRRMFRVPNTLNDGRYCCPLPFEFRKMNIEEILDYSKTQHSINFFPGDLQTIQELAGDFKVPQRNESEEFKDEIKVGSIPSMDILEELIRPCVIKEIQKSNPGSIARLDFVSEMMFASFTPKQILEVIKNLDWDNFDERQTEYQIRKVFERRLKPYSNSKLKEAFGCDSNSYYWW